MSDKILIAWSDAEGIAERLAARGVAPESLILASTDKAAQAALAERPEVVFSIRMDGSDNAVFADMVAADSVKWIHVGGSGVDHIPRWDEARLKVTNSKGVLAPFLAEVTIGAMISLSFGFAGYAKAQAERRWAPGVFSPLHGKTLAVVGYGAIGEEVAKRARAMGMRVIGVRRTPAPSPHVDDMRAPSALLRTLGEADVVSLHLRLNDETRKSFDAEKFAAMKPGAMFVNTSRGGVVDEPALIAALESGHLSKAYLDVTDVEPLPPESPIWTAPNLILTPHCSDQVDDWYLRFADFFVENLARWRAGDALRNPVAPPAG